MADEKVFLSEGDIFVSNSRIALAGTTYSTSNITSVSMASIPPSRGCAMLLVATGGLFCLAALGTMGDNAGAGVLSLVIGAGILAGAIFWLKSLKPTYHLLLSSASGEQRALNTKDHDLIHRVVSAVNNAIVSRG
jgi:hypothetical protein